MSMRPVSYSAQEILYYLDGNFAILVPWVAEITAIVIVRYDLQKKPSVTQGTIQDDGFKSDIEGFESNNDASGARLI